MTESSVTVVIPAYNCSETIAETIRALQRQTHRVDIVVVDDGSSDRTAEIVKSVNHVRYIRQENQGPAVARNTGAEAADCEFLFFTDSDCIPEDDWIEKAVRGFRDPRVGVVAGSYGIANANERLARGVHNEILYRHRFVEKNPKSFGSYNFGVRKKVFDSLGGFNTGYRYASGEDNDLSYRILKAGYKIHFDGNVRVAHFHPVSLRRYLKEQCRHGFWRAKMYLDHPDMASGDGYTFWKDIVEVPASLGVLVFAVLWPLGVPSAPFICLSLTVALLSLQVVFGFKMNRNVFDGIYYSGVMFLRSFSRSIGFSTGMAVHASKRILKKN